MRAVVVVFLSFICVYGQKANFNKRGPCDFLESGNQDNLNYCIDEFFKVNENYLNEKCESLPLSNLYDGFSHTFIFTYSGEVELKNGKLNGLSTVHRNGDIVLNLNSLIISSSLPISFKDLNFKYDYSAKIMGLELDGGVEGTISNLALEMKFNLNLSKKTVSLDSFQITNSGRMDFHFTGHALLDWLLDLLTDIVIKLLKTEIQDLMERVVGGALQEAVRGINNYLANHSDRVNSFSEFATLFKQVDLILN